MIDSSNNEKTTQKNELNLQNNTTITKILRIMRNFANTGLGRFLIGFGNALIAGDSGGGTSMAVASGYLYNPKIRKWELSKENLKEAKELRNNLTVLSTFSPTHPATALTEKVIIPGVMLGVNKISPYIKQGLKYTKNISFKIGDSIEKLRNRNIRMTHTTTMDDIRTSVSKENRSLIVPSFSIYKNSGNNLFMYNKGTQPVIFIGNKKILNSPNYVQMKGDLGVRMLDDVDFSKSNFELSDEYIKMYGDEIKSRGVPFKLSRKNLKYVNYNEGKYLGELPYEETSYIIGPDIKEFKEIFKDHRFITYPNEWSTLNTSELRNNLQKLIEELYKKTKDIRLKKGGKINE